MPATVMTRFSYPKSPGDQPWSIVDVTGPVSYVPVVSGNPPTGGLRLTAADCGLQSIDWIMPMDLSNGQAFINCYPAPFNPGNPLSAVVLQFMVMTGTPATPAEVGAGTNLSALTVRLLAIGH